MTQIARIWIVLTLLTAVGAVAAISEASRARLEREIRHEMVTLPYYGVFDNLAFRIDNDGNVTLLGQVARPSLKSSVERVVKNVEGVEGVRNEITVLPTSSMDDQIRVATYRAIYAHPALNRYSFRAVPPIHIIVNNGKLTLEGIVANSADKQIAGIQANSVSGVFSVENNLRVENQKDDEAERYSMKDQQKNDKMKNKEKGKDQRGDK